MDLPGHCPRVPKSRPLELAVRGNARFFLREEEGEGEVLVVIVVVVVAFWRRDGYG